MKNRNNFLRGHVFVVDKFSWPVHRSRLFCGVKNPKDEKTRFSLYADLKAIRENDIVIFYQRRIDEPPENRGFRGYFKVVSEPFFDEEDIEWEENINGKKVLYKVLGKCPYCGTSYSEKFEANDNKREPKCVICGKPLVDDKLIYHILPNRILIEPVEYYELPVDDNTAYIDVTDQGVLRTMLFRKIWGPGRERSISHLLPEETEKIIRLLRRVNENKVENLNSIEYPKTSRKKIKIELGEGPMVKHESVLEAWMMENIDKDYDVLKEVIGPSNEIEYFGNNVLYGIGGEKVDILVTHINESGIRYKASVIELKKGNITKDAISQVKKYAYWIGQLVTANYIIDHEINKLTLQPILIGYDTAKNLNNELSQFKRNELKINYLNNRTVKIEIEQIKVLKYLVEDGKIKFTIETH